MKQLLFITTLLATTAALAEVKVIYGVDNRKDVYQTSNALHLTLAKSTAGMVSMNSMIKGGLPNTYEIIDSPTLGEAQNLCTSEAYSTQPISPNCSGFLVGQDILVTAGHCYKTMGSPEDTCKAFAWVFDYNMKSAKHNPSKNIPLSNVYLCKKVLHAELNGLHDFSIIKLDRKVVGRQPLKIRSTGKVSNTAKLLVIGHPSGLPTKIADNGKVTLNNRPTTFSTTLDTFAGNSGSAVFDSATGEVQGILIQGKTDYRPSLWSNPLSCQVVNRCDDNAKNCIKQDAGMVEAGEVVYRMEQIAAKIKQAQTLKK